MHSMLAVLLLLFAPVQTSTATKINPIYAPVTMEHGSLSVTSDGDENLMANSAVAGETELSDEWKWRGVTHRVKTVKRSSESEEQHAKRHQKAVLANLDMFPPDPPSTQG